MLGAFGVVIPGMIGAQMGVCVTSFIALLLISGATRMVTSYGANAGWVYDPNSVVIGQRDFFSIDDNSPNNHGYVPLMGNLHLPDNKYDGSYLHSLFAIHAEHLVNNITFATPVFTNHTGSMEILGYAVGHQSDLGHHVAFGEVGTEEEMIMAMGKFNGSNYVPGFRTKEYTDVATNHTLVKRDSGGSWMSFTDWGTNVGYDEDMLQWNEYQNFAREHSYDGGFGMVDQVQSCTNMQQCYGIKSKMCVTSQMSQQRGVDDIMSGEMYYGAYGGVDNECDSG